MAAHGTLSRRRLNRKGGATSAELESFHDIADDVIESDFVPYACLFDPSSIATKDGELLQTIKITGLSYDSTHGGDLRSTIREAIRTALPDDSYAIWLHTLRRRQAAPARTHYPDSFSGKLDEAWRALQPASLSYVNELYITIVKAGEPVSLRHPFVFRQSLLPGSDRRLRTQAMQVALKELHAVTANMVTRLAAFGARQLSMVERGGVFYSEQLEFLEKLVNLDERLMPVPEQDLSHILTSSEITFGFNAMEVRSATGVRRFAAILTLKEYKESTLRGIDKFLEIPCEIIVSQCFDFTGFGMAQAAYEKQARYLRYSGDIQLAQWMEIDRLTNGTGVETSRNFGQQQTTIFLISHSVSQLEGNVRIVQRALNRLGMLVVREDLRFEECYWSQLPANFTFVSRKYPVDTEHLAGFCNLQNAPMGNAAGSPWGSPISTFATLQDAPYYFNFHRGQSAHSIVLGNAAHSAKPFAHFLLAQARKLPLSIWYIDVTGKAAPLIKAMGGEYRAPGAADCMLNPLVLADTPAQREFLALWISTLVDATGFTLNRSTLSFFQSVVNNIMQLPPAQRRLQVVVDMVREADALLASALQRFVAGGIYGELFDNPRDSFTAGRLSAWDIKRWMDDPATRVPLTGYLLHRLTAMLSQSPTLIVLDDGLRLLDTPLFSARIGGWCDYLTKQNAAMLLISDDVAESAARPYDSVLAAKSATIFAMADNAPDAGYASGFSFSPETMAALSIIDGGAHQLLQKRGEETVVIRTGLADLPAALLQILSGDSAAAPNSMQSA